MTMLSTSDAASSSSNGGANEASSCSSSVVAMKSQNGLLELRQRASHSPTMPVSSLTVDVNSPPASPTDQSMSSSIASTTPNTTVIIDKNQQQQQQQQQDKSKRSRRRRKAKTTTARGNQVEPVQHNNNNSSNSVSSSSINSSSPALKMNSPHSRSQYNNNNNNNNSYNNPNQYQPSPQQQQKQQQKGSSFRSPIVTWRSNNKQNRRNNNNNNSNYHHQQQQQQQYPSSSPYNNNRNYIHNSHSPHHSSNNNNNNNNNNKNSKNYTSPRNFNNNNNNNNNGSLVCSASTGFPTSKKQHDAPMKKRDLYFSLHVEKVGIANEKNDNEQQQQHKKSPARVTLVNWENEVVLDTFLVVPVPVTDFYDTQIRPEDLRPSTTATTTTTITTDNGGDKGNNAVATSEVGVVDDSSSSSSITRSLADVRTEVERMLRGKILIGYELDGALQGLGLTHPKSDMRDSSAYFSSSSFSSLEEIGQKILDRTMNMAVPAPTPTCATTTTDVMMMMNLVTDDGISRRPIQSCVTTLDLYKNNRKEWEEALIAEAREQDRKQQDHINMISRQRQQEQQQQQQQRQQQQQQQQQLYREPSLLAVSLHCDLVQTVLSGRTKTLARVTLVDGPTRNVLMDEFAQIHVPVTDFCGTGITAKDVKVGNSSGANWNNSQNISAKPLAILRVQVERLLRGRLVVGHKVEDDLKALGLACPWTHVRDLAYFPAFLREKVVGGSRVVTVRSLDELSDEFLRYRLTPLGDRSRSTDLCRTALCLYETFRDQWERQQEETYRLQHQQHHHQQQHQQGRMMPTPSPSSVSSQQSPHHQQFHHYGQQQQQQPVVTPYGPAASMMSSPLPPHLPLPRQQQQKASMLEEQDSDSQSRINITSSWFPWGKHQPQPQTQQNHVAAVSPMLSPQAFQFLQEDPANQQVSASSKTSFFQQDNNSSISSFFGSSLFPEDATDSRYEGSMMSGGDDSRRSDTPIDKSEDLATASVVSSLRDDTSSVVSSDQASSIGGSSPATKNGISSSSSSSSSWFRFGSRKSKCSSSSNENKNHFESMAAVQESEVLTDDCLSPPIALFSSSPQKETDDDDAVVAESQQKPSNEEEHQQESSLVDPPMSSSPSTMHSRSWLRFRRSSNSSPGRKDRSRSPSLKLKSEANFENFSVEARSEVSDDSEGTEAIEITLAIPSASSTEVEAEDSISPLAEKSTLPFRPGASWFGLRRSSKSSSKSKNVNYNVDSLTKASASTKASTLSSLTKGSVPSGTCHQPELEPSATLLTTAFDEDWLQEVMSMSTTGGDTGEMKPWFPETGQKDSEENLEKTSLGQSSWFAFKRSKDDNEWKNLPSGASFMSFPDSTEQEADPNTIIINSKNEHSNINDVFRSRTRLLTESTIPSVATEEPYEETSEEEEYSDSEGYTKELENGAAQSFSFLKI